MKTLGEKTNYPQKYDTSVLDRVPRQTERSGIGIINDKLPFTGVDVWHLYEVSFLLN
ncbi:MAG: NADPH-dependent 7-cyano-7-deazaguanine reductase QueF, partial [Candidatus Cloacimonetes bacterium]|nr:NADPH-dependent 7-cyano-7-deazaguanine reductase QueF [Candidatus Cloacimonadota bacterium]